MIDMHISFPGSAPKKGGNEPYHSHRPGPKMLMVTVSGISSFEMKRKVKLLFDIISLLNIPFYLFIIP